MDLFDTEVVWISLVGDPVFLSVTQTTGKPQGYAFMGYLGFSRVIVWVGITETVRCVGVRH